MRPRTLLIAVGVLVLVVVLIGGCGLIVAASSLPSGEHPDVDFRNSEISAARAAVLPELNAQLDGMEARFGRTHVGPRARLDRCEAGADDFTRQDRYAYTCRLAVIELMPVAEPFKRNASLLGEALLEGNCPDGTDTDRALAEPFDHPRQLDSSRGDCTPGFSVPRPRNQEVAHRKADGRRSRRGYVLSPLPTVVSRRILRLDPARCPCLHLCCAGRYGVRGDRRRRRVLLPRSLGLSLARVVVPRQLPRLGRAPPVSVA